MSAKLSVALAAPLKGLQISVFRSRYRWFCWFDSLQLEQRQVAPPYNPSVENDRDLQHFDTQFTDEAPTLTPDDPNVIAKIDQSEFDGFEYVNPLQMSKEDAV